MNGILKLNVADGGMMKDAEGCCAHGQRRKNAQDEFRSLLNRRLLLYHKRPLLDSVRSRLSMFAKIYYHPPNISSSI